MDDEKPDLAERLGRAVNELDIDFSRFTVTGWIVSLLSLTAGCVAAWAAYEAVQERIDQHDGPPLVLGLTMIAVTTVAFLSLRWVTRRAGLPITRRRRDDNASAD